MGMTEDEFWRCSPKVYKLRLEAYVRIQYRTYVIGLHSQPLAGGEVLTGETIFRTMRLGAVKESVEDETITIDEDTWNGFLAKIQ